MTALLVVLGGALGAPLRYLVDRAVRARHDSLFPWGTLTVNALGSFILGVLVGGVATHAIPNWLGALVGTGLCGALTTYSTFGYETIRLLLDRATAVAVLNALLSVAVGLGAAACGITLAYAVSR